MYVPLPTHGKHISLNNMSLHVIMASQSITAQHPRKLLTINMLVFKKDLLGLPRYALDVTKDQKLKLANSRNLKPIMS